MGIEVSADPDDAKVLATAVAGKVDAIIGNDTTCLTSPVNLPCPSSALANSCASWTTGKEKSRLNPFFRNEF